MEQKFCQSCGMPLTDKFYGTNANNSKNEDYCSYCFENGKFTKECTMEEMIEHCAQFLDEYNKDADNKLTKADAVAQMRLHFPEMKRWKKTV